MPENRPLQENTSGEHEEIIPLVSSSGAPDASKLVQTDPGGKLDPSLFPAGFGADVTVLEASEALSAGDFVNIFDDGGTIKVRKAQANSIATKADGFVLAAVSAAANASVYRRGENNQLTLTAGSRYFLSPSTPGSVDVAAPSGNNEIVQPLGVAHSTTAMDFELVRAVIRKV